jgi:hypothetical protein
MTITKKQYSYLIVTVIWIDVHPTRKSSINMQGSAKNPHSDFWRKRGSAIRWLDVDIGQEITRIKWFEDRDRKYAQVHGCWREIEITLPCRRINTVLWNLPSWIYDGHPIMLVKCHGSGNPWILQEFFKTKVLALTSNPTAISILKLQIWDCYKENLTMSWIPQLKRHFSCF